MGALCVATFAGAPAVAHQTNLTIGEVRLEGAEIRYRLRISAHDLAVVLDIPTDFAAPIPAGEFVRQRDLLVEYVDEKLLVEGDAKACPRIGLDMEFSRLPDDVLVDLTYRCPAPPERLRIAYRLFFAVDPGHRAIGTVAQEGDVQQYVLDRNAADIEVTVGSPLAGFAGFGRLVLLGAEHILAGLDHVLFVVALLLGGGSFWALVRTVTAFTVAHSVTLSLAWFGVLDLPTRPVEIAIAASVAYVAIENMLGRGMGHRWAVAFAFGLVHGLGFFGVLSELDLGPAGTATTLLGFNLGVELGQLMIVALVYPLVRWSARSLWYRPAAVTASGAILAVALLWIAERAFLV